MIRRVRTKILATVALTLSLLGLGLSGANPAGAIYTCVLTNGAHCWVMSSSGTVDISRDGNHIVVIKHGPNDSYVTPIFDAWMPAWCVSGSGGGDPLVQEGNFYTVQPATMLLGGNNGKACLNRVLYNVNASTPNAWQSRPATVGCGNIDVGGYVNYFGKYNSWVYGTNISGCSGSTLMYFV